MQIREYAMTCIAVYKHFRFHLNFSTTQQIFQLCPYHCRVERRHTWRDPVVYLLNLYSDNWSCSACTAEVSLCKRFKLIMHNGKRYDSCRLIYYLQCITRPAQIFPGFSCRPWFEAVVGSWSFSQTTINVSKCHPFYTNGNGVQTEPVYHRPHSQKD